MWYALPCGPLPHVSAAADILKGGDLLLGKAHLTCGIAAALAVTLPSTPAGCMISVIGGAAGGILCDIEVRSAKRDRDALVSRLILLLLIFLALVADSVFHLGLKELLVSDHAARAASGLLIIVLTCVRGRFSEHRSFTHSLLYAFLLGLGGWQILPAFGISLGAGALSHLFLDLLNKKPLRIFYPLKKGICLRMFYADRLASRVCMWAGLLADILLLSYCLSSLWH